jgi:DNA-binding NarL/FixJ family response regulator
VTEHPSSIRIAIADDHLIFRDGLKRLLESEAAFKVVGEAADGIEASEIVRSSKPDVLVLDVAMPRMGGVDTVVGLTAETTRIVLLTAAIEASELLRAIQFGARRVVLKEAASKTLIDAIYRVMDGKYVIPSGIVDDCRQAANLVAGPSARKYGLTNRELDIIEAIVAGATNREIADRFAISVPTVKHHLSSIFDKTGVSSRLELAIFAVHGDLVRPPEPR